MPTMQERGEQIVLVIILVSDSFLQIDTETVSFLLTEHAILANGSKPTKHNKQVFLSGRVTSAMPSICPPELPSPLSPGPGDNSPVLCNQWATMSFGFKSSLDNG